MMCNDCRAMHEIGILERGADAAEVLARAALPPGYITAPPERMDRAAHHAGRARMWRDEAERPRGMLG